MVPVECHKDKTGLMKSLETTLEVSAETDGMIFVMTKNRAEVHQFRFV